MIKRRQSLSYDLFSPLPMSSYTLQFHFHSMYQQKNRTWPDYRCCLIFSIKIVLRCSTNLVESPINPWYSTGISVLSFFTSWHLLTITIAVVRTTLRLINLEIWQLNLYIDVLFMTRGASFQASDHKHRVAFVAALRAVFKTVRAI